MRHEWILVREMRFLISEVPLYRDLADNSEIMYRMRFLISEVPPYLYLEMRHEWILAMPSSSISSRPNTRDTDPGTTKSVRTVSGRACLG